MTGRRPPTAFELFLQRRQQDAADSKLVEKVGCLQTREGREAPLTSQQLKGSSGTTPSPPPRFSSDQPQQPPSGQHQRGSRSHPEARSPGHVSPRHRDDLDLRPQLLASFPGKRATRDGTATGAAKPATPASAAVYSELATAAASLASAAHKLASRSPYDAAVASSYETLAQAASDLAASACMIRPLVLPGSAGGGRHGGGGGSRAGPRGGQAAEASASAPQAQGRSPSRGAMLHHAATSPAAAAAGKKRHSGANGANGGGGGIPPRAVDPVADSVGAGAPVDFTVPNSGGGAAAGGAGGAGWRRPDGGAGAPSGRPFTGASAGSARVSVPRFPSYNPLIHVMESDLPIPGTDGAARHPASSPITHQLGDSRLLRSSDSRASGAASQHCHWRGSRTSHGADPRRPGSILGYPPPSQQPPLPQPLAASRALRPEDLSRLPVLSLGVDGDGADGGGGGAAQFSAGAAGGAVWSSERLQLERGGGGTRRCWPRCATGWPRAGRVAWPQPSVTATGTEAAC